MKYRVMPCNGAELSEIGLGLAKIHLGERAETQPIIEKALENGINFFDLCGNDMDVHRDFGRAMKGKDRSKVYTQMHFGAVYDENDVYGRIYKLDKVKDSFERVLDAAQTDYTDFGMIHCIDSEEVYASFVDEGILDYMADLKKQGVVKHIGISTHTPAMAKRVIDDGIADMMMFSINPAYDYAIGKWAGGHYDERMDLYTAAEQKNIGITVMKIFSGGLLLDEATSPIGVALSHHQCMRYALDRPGVVSILPGATSLKELDILLDYYNAYEEDTRYTVLKKAAPKEAQGRCVYCSHCAPCPKGIDIALVNKYYDLAKGGDPLAADHYMTLKTKAGACVECGKCRRRCPFGVDQPERMMEIRKYFKK
ncbi:MAG: aldo/keto reductase [Firmicutes bacterium]|nr:aldo/keto reductase [Bacillota bacterium]